MEAKSDQLHLLPDGHNEWDEDVKLSQARHERLRKSAGTSRLAALSFMAALIISIASFWAGNHWAMRKSSLDAKCAEHTIKWSPIHRDISIQYRTQLLNETFVAENIYRQEPSPQVDKAWEDLGVMYRSGYISYEDGLASGFDSTYVQRDDKYGGGFLVNVQGMHYLHCLNVLRKATYFNFDHYRKQGGGIFMDNEPTLRRHVTHCVDSIRQKLMCTADTGMIGHVWAESDGPKLFPYFTRKHTCTNFDQVRQWAENLQGPDDDLLPVDYLATPHPEDVLPFYP